MTTLKNILVRKAALEDIDGLTELHCLSFKPEEHVPMMLGRRYVQSTYRWLISSGFSYVLVAETANGIVGLAAVADGPFTSRMFFACLPELVFSIVINPKVLLKHSLWKRFIRQTELSQQGHKIASNPGMAQAVVMAVHPQFRGRGVLGELVRGVQVHCLLRGSRAVRAGIYKSNLRSKRAFSKLEWIESRELETRDTVFFVYYIDPKFKQELGLISND